MIKIEFSDKINPIRKRHDTMKKCILSILFTLISTLSLLSQTAEVSINFAKGKSVREYKLEKIGENTLRLIVPKNDIPKDAKSVDISTDFSVANIGDDGYFILPRGDIVDFNAPEGVFDGGRLVMPIMGMKTSRQTFWLHIKTMRHEARGRAFVKDGVFTQLVRYEIATMSNGAYDDIVIEYNFLPKNSGYVEMGKAYRNYLLKNKIVRPIKKRMKDAPFLEYIAKSIPVRIQFHGSKPRQDKDFTPETEPPIVPVLDFKKSIEFVETFKNLGINEVSFCSAGWQSGGYDGRFPDLFPIPEELGGETQLRKFIERVKELGYTIHAHTNSTDCYTCSRMWNNGEIAAKDKDGKPQRGHFWGGGRAYNLCTKHARDNYLFAQLKQVKKLGFQAPHYIDVFSAVPPNMCADPNHPATREEMAQAQRDIAQYCQKLFGGFASESGYDHVGGELDYVNYVTQRMNAWHKSKEGKPSAIGKQGALYIDNFVPLWEIVYHGIILSNPDRLTQNHTLGKAITDNSGDLKFNKRDGIQDPYATLKLYEFGGRPIFYTSNFAEIPLIKKAYDEFLPFRHLQLETIEEHKYLTPDVTLTVFGNGEEIVCNYGSTKFKYKGITINPATFNLINVK